MMMTMILLCVVFNLIFPQLSSTTLPPDSKPTKHTHTHKFTFHCQSTNCNCNHNARARCQHAVGDAAQLPLCAIMATRCGLWTLPDSWSPPVSSTQCNYLHIWQRSAPAEVNCHSRRMQQPIMQWLSIGKNLSITAFTCSSCQLHCSVVKMK